jgi:hypothetical protein
MADSSEVLIGSSTDEGAQYVLIRPMRRSLPGLFDSGEDTGNWIECDLEFAVGAFRAAFPAHLRSEEFQSFLEEAQDLRRTLEGAATFTTLEGQLALSLNSDEGGTLRVNGEAIDDAGSGNRLQFKFDVDQSRLHDICASLEHLLAAFPVAGRSDVA